MKYMVQTSGWIPVFGPYASKRMVQHTGIHPDVWTMCLRFPEGLNKRSIWKRFLSALCCRMLPRLTPCVNGGGQSLPRPLALSYVAHDRQNEEHHCHFNDGRYCKVRFKKDIAEQGWVSCQPPSSPTELPIPTEASSPTLTPTSPAVPMGCRFELYYDLQMFVYCEWIRPHHMQVQNSQAQPSPHLALLADKFEVGFMPERGSVLYR